MEVDPSIKRYAQLAFDSIRKPCVRAAQVYTKHYLLCLLFSLKSSRLVAFQVQGYCYLTIKNGFSKLALL